MFKEDILLSKHSNYNIGGPAKYFFETKNIDEVIKALEKARQFKTSVFVLGGGTNILFSDEGFNGLILKQNIQSISREGNFLKVGAGMSVSQLLNYLTEAGLSGLEWAAGLPGTVGGAIRGNAGSFGGETGTVVDEVFSLDISRPEKGLIRRKKQACKFGYRSSVFKLDKNREIILEATLVFQKGDRKLIQEIVGQNINYRREKQPLEHPSVGSIFKNVPFKKMNEKQRKKFSAVIKTDPFPVIPAAHLIFEAGLAGISCGGAMISPKHPNFIVNVLRAKAKDVKNLIELVKKEVKKRFEVDLEEEITYLA